MTSRTTSVLTIAGITALGIFAYAVYFDYKRRNDVDFRKKLKKDKKRVDKSIASSKASLPPDASAVSVEELREVLEQVKAEQVPAAPDQKEAYFMTQVASGESLSQQGPMFILPAALAFYRALRVYPSPVELMMIYQKTVPEPIFKIVIELTNLDVSMSGINGGPLKPSMDDLDDETSPVRGPPSESSSQEWDKLST